MGKSSGTTAVSVARYLTVYASNLRLFHGFQYMKSPPVPVRPVSWSPARTECFHNALGSVLVTQWCRASGEARGRSLGSGWLRPYPYLGDGQTQGHPESRTIARKGRMQRSGSPHKYQLRVPYMPPPTTQTVRRIWGRAICRKRTVPALSLCRGRSIRRWIPVEYGWTNNPEQPPWWFKTPSSGTARTYRTQKKSGAPIWAECSNTAIKTGLHTENRITAPPDPKIFPRSPR